MRELLVLLISSSELVAKSIELQSLLSKVGYEFKINFQDGRFAHFTVITNLCAAHFDTFLRAHGFNVEVSDASSNSQETCHDCRKMVA